MHKESLQHKDTPYASMISFFAFNVVSPIFHWT